MPSPPCFSLTLQCERVFAISVINGYSNLLGLPANWRRRFHRCCFDPSRIPREALHTTWRDYQDGTIQHSCTHVGVGGDEHAGAQAFTRVEIIHIRYSIEDMILTRGLELPVAGILTHSILFSGSSWRAPCTVNTLSAPRFVSDECGVEDRVIDPQRP